MRSISGLIGIILGILGVYSGFFYEKKPELTIDIISHSQMISVSEEVDDLKVLFKKRDISKKHQQLSIFTVRISNVGNGTINTGDFDENALFNIAVKGGQLITADVVSASHKYLRRVFKKGDQSTNQLFFKKFILEPTQFFVFKLMILHKEKEHPALIPGGVIAGIDAMNIYDASVENSEN